MTTYTIKGRVEAVGETVEVGSNGFRKRNFVIETNGADAQYQNPVQVTLKKDRCALADGLREGDAVEVDVTIDGRKWDSGNGVRYFTDLTAWAVRRGATAKDAKAAWIEVCGSGRDKDFVEYCKAHAGKQSSADFTPFDWGKVCADIRRDGAANANANAPTDGGDDLPF
jgi:hypothetical protein